MSETDIKGKSQYSKTAIW